MLIDWWFGQAKHLIRAKKYGRDSSVIHQLIEIGAIIHAVAAGARDYVVAALPFSFYYSITRWSYSVLPLMAKWLSTWQWFYSVAIAIEWVNGKPAWPFVPKAGDGIGLLLLDSW